MFANCCNKWSRIAVLALARAPRGLIRRDLCCGVESAALLRLNTIEKEIQAIHGIQPPQRMPPPDEQAGDFAGGLYPRSFNRRQTEQQRSHGRFRKFFDSGPSVLTAPPHPSVINSIVVAMEFAVNRWLRRSGNAR